MKSALYVGATLMMGASIYGFVDYQQTSHKKEFTSMYVEEKKPAPEVVVKEQGSSEENEPAKDATTITKKEKAIKKEASKNYPAEETITPVKPIPEEEQMNSSDSKKIEEATVTVTPSEEHSVFKKVKRKKVNTKIFSRAPLRDEIEEVKVVPEKKEIKEKQ